MRAIVCGVLAALMLVSLLSVGVCAEGQDLLAAIQERGTIIIGLEGDWAPWSFVDENDQLMGFDVEVAPSTSAAS